MITRERLLIKCDIIRLQIIKVSLQCPLLSIFGAEKHATLHIHNSNIVLLYFATYRLYGKRVYMSLFHEYGFIVL